MKITDIKQAAKNKNKANIYIDGAYQFSLYLSDLANLNLSIGMEISDSLYEKIQETILFKNALNDSLKMIAKADCPSKKIREKLTLKEYPEQIILNVLSYLIEKGYLNDYEFAKKYIENAMLTKKKGKAYIELELYKRGIKREVITDLLEKHYQSDGILAVAKSKFESLKNKSMQDEKTLRKLKEYLFRQGFSFDEINFAVNELTGKENY